MVPAGRTGVEALVCDGFEVLATGGAYREIGGAVFAARTGILRKMEFVDEDVSERGIVREEARKASLAMRFSSQSIAAAYHS